MITSFYCLRALAAELHTRLAGSTLGQPFSQSSSELIIPLTTADGTATSIRHFIGAGPRYLFTDDRFRRAKKNVADIFRKSNGATITDVTISRRDRVVNITLGDSLLVLAHTGSSSNAFLLDAADTIVEAFQKNDSHVGKHFSMARPAPEFPEFDDWSGYMESRLAAGETKEKALAASYPFFDRTMAGEILDRARNGGDVEPKLETVYQTARDFDAMMMAAASAHIEKMPDGTRRFLLYHPRQPAGEVEHWDSINESIKAFLLWYWSQRALERTSRPVRQALERRLQYLQKSVASVRTGLDRESKAAIYRAWADTLMAWQGTIRPGSDTISIPDLTDPERTVVIPVRPGLGKFELAEHYYDRARASAKRRQVDAERLKRLQSERDEIEILVEQSKKLYTREEWEDFASEHAEILGLDRSGHREQQQDDGFRRYMLRGDYEVLVGRNASENDRLTTHVAGKEDYWLHARGVAGSHVVLRVKGKQEPPADVVEKAASIAAFHSKSRTSSLAPVIVVKRKYVRKPKGAQKGTVVVDRERVLLVEPKLPRNKQD